MSNQSSKTGRIMQTVSVDFCPKCKGIIRDGRCPKCEKSTGVNRSE